MTTLKRLYFIGFFGLFHFVCFSLYCFYFSNIKRQKQKKSNLLFENLMLTSPKFCKNTILAQCDTICVYKHTPQNTIKMGKTVKRKLGPVFNFKLGPVLTLKPPNLGPVFNFTAYIYIYLYLSIYIYAVGRGFGPLEVVIWSPKRFPLQNRAF